MNIVGYITNEDAIAIKKKCDKEWMESNIEKHKKSIKICIKLSSFVFIACIILFGLLYIFLNATIGIMSFLVPLILWGIGTIGICDTCYEKLKKDDETEEEKLFRYPLCYRVWFYTKDKNIIKIKRDHFCNKSESLWLVLENKEDCTVSEKYIGNITKIHKTDISDIIYDFEKETLFIPYKKDT